MTLQRRVRQRVLNDLAEGRPDESAQLNDALRLLSKWRSVLIQNTHLREHGTAVMAGPLEGLDYLSRSAEGCLVAKLLGCYEQPLHAFIERAVETAYPVVLNIGCAEGYYAVGLARRMPDTVVQAFDIDPRARQLCVELAARNGVGDRVRVGALFEPRHFADYEGRKVLVFCDIEGAEKDLLNPDVAPALRCMDLIVESHECFSRGVTRLLVERFASSHEMTLVQDNGQRRLQKSPAWFNRLSHLDQLLATWEWRGGPTPWLVMKAHQDR